MDGLRAKLDALPGQSFPAGTVASADEFAYDDPVDGSRSEGQGLRIAFDNGSRIVLRLSGTGTVGATLRVYLEAVEEDQGRLHKEAETALADIAATAEEIASIREFTGRDAPDVKT